MTPFVWPLRVYWEDTDGGGIVYYANYLKFLERARSEWLRARGFSQEQLARETGIIFSVIEVAARYRKPARLDDELSVSCEPQREGRASVRFLQRVTRGDATGPLLLDAEVRVACLDARTLRPKGLPDFVLEGLA